MIKPWRLVGKKDVSVGKWFPLEERVYEKNNKGVVDDFTVALLEDVSLVVPVTKNKNVVMVYQFKPGAGEMTYEFPGGRLKQGQDYLAAAKGELLEETGMVASEFEQLQETVTFPTKCTERVMNFIGWNAEKTQEQLLDEHEEIEVCQFSVEEVDAMIADGRINTAPSIVAWYFAKPKIIARLGSL